MTITYTAEVANCSGLGCFWKLLFRWKGSIYKLLWPNLVVYILLYYSLYFVYLFALDAEGQAQFEKISQYCLTYSDLIPLSFVLGFYVNLVVKRWWEMFQSIPSTDTLALFVSNSIHGTDDRSRQMRRNIMRYVILSYIMILSMVSTRVKKRFPTMDHLIEAGVLHEDEKKIFQDFNARIPYSKYWMPLVWAGSIVARARKEGRIRDDFAVKTLLDELCAFRSKCGALNGYDWVPVPLVYTQVVTLAVYTFFVATLMGRQLVGDQKNLYVPIFAFLQFFFYMGWLKVAETLVNPFGEDDDDFETEWLIDRNYQVAFLIVDEMHSKHPELIQDKYWDDIVPDELPHTVASQAFRKAPFLGSTAHLEMTAFEAEIIPAASQLDKLDEESEVETEDDGLIPSDGGESGLPIRKSSRKRVVRQTSVSSEAPNSFSSATHLKVSRKASVASMLNRVFGKDNSAMGSTMSISSHAGRKGGYVRSNSRISTGGPSRPHSPFITSNQDDIFKMSDLSLAEGSTVALNTNNDSKPPTAPINLAPSNSKRLNDNRWKLGKNKSVEGPGLVSVDTDDEEPLISSSVPSPAIQLTTSAQNSPMTRQKQFLPPKSSPKNVQKTEKNVQKIVASPQNSPKTTRMPPVAFFMGSDGSQTDRAAVPPTRIPLTEVEEDVAGEEEVKIDIDTKNPTSSVPTPARPIVNPSPRIHKDSGREVAELEPIEEQSERLESSSVDTPEPPKTDPADR